VLTIMYVRLARGEEGAVRTEFGAVYERYASEVPAFIPRISRLLGQRSSNGYRRG